MSTRGWYEYYVIDTASGRMTLSMQFFKWGDATPENALCELRFFRKKIESKNGRLPVYDLDRMLKEQLGQLYEKLPENFSVAAYLFMLQRAWETLDVFEQWRWDRLKVPKEERPDYRLGYEIGKAIGFHYPSWEDEKDPHIREVRDFIVTGRHVRPWKNYGLVFSVLDWLQYLTQVTFEKDMGSIAGYTAMPFDADYIHRFFIWVSAEKAFEIGKLAIELCDRSGRDLLSFISERVESETDMEEYEIERLKKLDRNIKSSGIETFSLSRARKEFAFDPDRFWSIKSYEYPELAESVANE